MNDLDQFACFRKLMNMIVYFSIVQCVFYCYIFCFHNFFLSSIFTLTILTSYDLLKVDFFSFCSLHWQQQEQITFTILQNGPQNRYHGCSIWAVPANIVAYIRADFTGYCILTLLLYQGSLNKFHGQHALRERARKLDQGILIIRYRMNSVILFTSLRLLPFWMTLEPCQYFVKMERSTGKEL